MEFDYTLDRYNEVVCGMMYGSILTDGNGKIIFERDKISFFEDATEKVHKISPSDIDEVLYDDDRYHEVTGCKIIDGDLVLTLGAVV